MFWKGSSEDGEIWSDSENILEIESIEFVGSEIRITSYFCGLSNCIEGNTFRHKEKLERRCFCRGREIKSCRLAMSKLRCLLGIILDFSESSSLEDINLGVIAMQIVFNVQGTR